MIDTEETNDVEFNQKIKQMTPIQPKKRNTSTNLSPKPRNLYNEEKKYKYSLFSPMKNEENFFPGSDNHEEIKNKEENCLNLGLPGDKYSSSNHLIIKETTGSYDIKSLLGKGAYSTVFLVTNIDTKQKYAMKTISKLKINNEGLKNQIIKEKDIMKMLHHPNIVKLHSTFSDINRVYFIIEYVSSRSLRDVLKQQQTLPLAITQFYAAELVSALEYLASKNIVHRDLKPDNILIDKNGHIKIIDFGGSTIYEPGNKNKKRGSFVGTKDYVSPEVILGKVASPSSDLWSVGCIIYEMLTGIPPFKASNESESFEKILRLELDFPKDISNEASDLCMRLLTLELDKRIGWNENGPNFQKLKTHPFFEGIDFENLKYTVPPSLPKKGVMRAASNQSLPDYHAVMNPRSNFEIKFQYFSESNQQFLDSLSPSRITISKEAYALVQENNKSLIEKRILLTSKPALRLYSTKKGGIFEKEIAINSLCKINKIDEVSLLFTSEIDELKIIVILK